MLLFNLILSCYKKVGAGTGIEPGKPTHKCTAANQYAIVFFFRPGCSVLITIFRSVWKTAAILVVSQFKNMFSRGPGQGY